VVATACAAGNSAIAFGVDALRSHRADAMVVGGVDEISQGNLLIFNSFRALAPDCVRPFDANRQGLLLGEGAAALCLEREDDARARGASILGRILACANVGEAHHMTAPRSDGEGARRAISTALNGAEIEAADVDHISAHGTGTRANDIAEARAIRGALGPHAERTPVTALKSALGHSQGAASAIEAVICLLAIRDGVIPPTANYENPDPECDLDVVHGKSRDARIRVALSNAFGFGGNIECLLLGAP
jgi:3-oxoacyl-(acyl-carrier-protein) synthase